MKSTSQGLSAIVGTRRWFARTLVAATFAAPGALALFAKDQPAEPQAAGDKEVVAKRTDAADRPAVDKNPLAPALDAAKAGRKAAQELGGYSGTFSKQEKTKKGMVRQTLKIKFRRQPFSVYLKFVDPNPGREVLYVDGKNKGKLLVREPSGLVSLAGTIPLSPTSDEVMKENRHPITLFGMEKLMDGLIAQWEAEARHGEVQVLNYPQAKVGESECRMVEVVHPVERKHFAYHKSRLYLDKKSGLPVRVEQYGFPKKAKGEAPLMEEYTYSDVKPEPKLTDYDFDVKNESYGFK